MVIPGKNTDFKDLAAKVMPGNDASYKGLKRQKIDALADKKILHAPFEIAGNMARITRMLRERNINATSANYYDSWLNYQCDINLNINKLPEPERLPAVHEFAEDAMKRYDIFHFHFAHSLYPDFRDLDQLKDKGKRILFSFWGSDQRSPEWIFYHQAKFLGYDPPKPYYLTLDLYQKHKIINLYADVMLGATCIPRGLWIPGQIDVSEWKLEDRKKLLEKNRINKDPRKTYFLHAPSSDWKKGSMLITSLLDDCKKDGMPIEVIYVKGLLPEKAKQIYAYTDYAIDQVGVGTFGLFGIEMLTWEIPVLAYHTELYDRLRNYPPVIKITKENFKQQIEKCIEMKKTGENIALGQKGRQWALKNADMINSIPQYLEIYSHLGENKQIKQFINTSWYKQEHLLQRGVKSDFYKYMIEEKIFDQLQLQIQNYDKRLYK
ncbi:MAG: glycosyltransferase [Deltaproteobacteria bacterium]|nr:glycosyltransferase [Deltaproteobacteria bacterium]